MHPSRRSRYAVRHRRALLASLALITVGTHAHAQEPTARLVKDANRTPGTFHSAISWVMPVGTAKNVVFPMDTLALGHELYISDGTPKGTRLLYDFIPGPDSSYLRDPVTFGTGENTRVAFIADSPHGPDPIYVTDGTAAGIEEIFHGFPGGQWATTMRASVPGGFFFESDVPSQTPDPDLYFSDGTPMGTRILNPLHQFPRERFSNPHAYVTGGSACYFIANNNEVWRSDGTEAGTQKVVTIPAGSGVPQTLAVAGSRLFVTSILDNHYQLLRCPTAGGDLTNITPPEAASWDYFELQSGSAIGDDIFFVSAEPDNVRSLWASDGFASGTRRIPLVHPGASAEPRVVGSVVKWKGSIYLRTRTLENNYQLWRSDGTTAGTIRVKDFAASNFFIPPHSQENSDSLVFNVTPPTDDGEVLWQTKGDEASTQPIKKTPDSFRSPSDGPQFALAQSGLIFSAHQSMPEAALYRVKGPNGGAIQLTKTEKTTGDGIPTHSTPPYEMLDGNLLQIVDTGKGLELWKSKPDGKGARSVWKIPGTIGQYPGHVGFHGTLSKSTVTNGVVSTTTKGAIFTLHDGEGHHEVWITNGTRPGTTRLSQHEALTSTAPPDFLKLGDTMFYSVPDEGATKKRSLWKTDGTPAGTSQVIAPHGFSPGPDAGEMVEFQDQIFFLSTSEIGRTTMWKVDATNGISSVMGRWIGAASETAASLSVVGGKLYIAVQINGEESLWESDGSLSSARKTTPALNFKPGSIRPAVDLNGVAVFQARGLQDNLDLWWRHSGNDTRPVWDLNNGEDIFPPEGGRYQAVVGSLLFYNGVNVDNGRELWVTDGTSNGTRRVKDINPGYLGSNPDFFLPAGNAVYFSARDEEHGYRLWRSDGTEAGTVPAASFGPGTEFSVARGLKAIGNKLYFHYFRHDIGEELHSIDLPQ